MPEGSAEGRGRDRPGGGCRSRRTTTAAARLRHPVLTAPLARWHHLSGRRKGYVVLARLGLVATGVLAVASRRSDHCSAPAPSAGPRPRAERAARGQTAGDEGLMTRRSAKNPSNAEMVEIRIAATTTLRKPPTSSTSESPAVIPSRAALITRAKRPKVIRSNGSDSKRRTGPMIALTSPKRAATPRTDNTPPLMSTDGTRAAVAAMAMDRQT